MSHAANTDLNNEAALSEDAFAFSGLAEAQAPDAAPAFTLVDDADGRFVIDARTGVISVADRDLVDQERNVVHDVRVRVTEAHDSYEMAVRLKITGVVPRLADDNLFSAADDFTAEYAGETAAAIERPAPFSMRHWLGYAAFAAQAGQLRDEAAFDGLLAPQPANGLTCTEAVLALDAAQPIFTAA